MSQNIRGLYFEEFEVGQEITTPSRTVTEADVVNFAGVSGDFNALHTDATFAAETPYEKRIAHGMLILSVATGLAARHGFIEGTTLAFREVTWKFNSPVFLGDTVHMKAKVKELKPMPKLGGGLVILGASMVNQDGKVVQRGEWRVLMKSKEA
ncbi:MAG: MaoC/PaaZ C-terminal domain-containing protein [Chloroflexota bacterium]